MPKVLVIDDDLCAARSLALSLSSHGFEVHSEFNASAALAHLERHSTDLVMVDLMLSGMNGIELARHVAEHFPHVRVVLTSAYHLSERQLVRSNCGAVGFVPKPYSLEEVTGFLRSKLTQQA
jgi:DNA-binding response OmpR family regulator